MVKNHASSLNQNIDITRQCHLTCFVSMCVPVPSWPSSNKYLGVNSLLLWWLLSFFLFSKYFAKKGRVSSSNQKEDKINCQWRYQQTHYCHSIELNWLSDTVFWHQTPSRIMPGHNSGDTDGGPHLCLFWRGMNVSCAMPESLRDKSQSLAHSISSYRCCSSLCRGLETSFSLKTEEWAVAALALCIRSLWILLALPD